MRRRKSGVIWAFATAAPWALAGGMLISFTAAAGQLTDAGDNFSSINRGMALTAIDVVPGTTRATATMIGLPALDLNNLLHSTSASLTTAAGEEAPSDSLRGELKRHERVWPEVVRQGKGDPAKPMAESVGRRSQKVMFGRGTFSQAVLGRDIELLPPTLLMEGSTEIPTADEMWAMEPVTEEDIIATRQALAPRTTPAYVRSEGVTVLLGDGATPASPRAQALASVTPVPADIIPVEIAAVPVSLPPGAVSEGAATTSAFAKMEAKRGAGYAHLIDADNIKREAQCLAEAVYFEARGESEAGQAAVAQVVLNRVKSGLYPTSVCGVVYQNRQRYKACQFSFACEGRSLRITDRHSWSSAVRVASRVTEGAIYNADVGGATHYHADYVRPFWASKLKKMDVIGRHVFYKLRPGQT